MKLKLIGIMFMCVSERKRQAARGRGRESDRVADNLAIIKRLYNSVCECVSCDSRLTVNVLQTYLEDYVRAINI